MENIKGLGTIILVYNDEGGNSSYSFKADANKFISIEDPTMSTNFLKKYLLMLQQTKPILTPIDQKRMKATTQNIKDK